MQRRRPPEASLSQTVRGYAEHPSGSTSQPRSFEASKTHGHLHVPQARSQTHFAIPRPELVLAHTSIKNMQNKSIEVGKYLVSPMIKTQADGSFAASVSIRSGRGMASHDRVMRFTPRFISQRAALRYATSEGLAWVRSR